MATKSNAVKVFVYTGREGAVVPQDVVRVRIDPSVLAISAKVFELLQKLEKVQLHESLNLIGEMVFFYCTALKEVQLSDGVKLIGQGAFAFCNFTKFRCPPLVTIIPNGMLEGCVSMFSLKLPERIIKLGINACNNCISLRNVALASNTVADENAFNGCLHLLQIFGTEDAIFDALTIRFDGLPVHGWIYYISYHNSIIAEEFLRTIIIGENGELDPSGLQQDCLGMTPIHILACSTVQCLEVYQMIVEKYPENLIVEDAWGATPLLYAVWGDAPSEIVQFLVNSYQFHYPDHEFNWNAMVITLGRVNVSIAVMQNLFDVKHRLSPGYNIAWEHVLEELVRSTIANRPYLSQETFCFLIRCSIATRINAIGVKHFRDAMVDDWTDIIVEFNQDNRQMWYTETLTKLEYYESEYQKLKETTSILELALWKIKIDDSIMDHGSAMGDGFNKLMKDRSDFRLQCRISCGADNVIGNVWPYLLPQDYRRRW